MDSRGAEKKERLLAALDQGMVMIHLDARRPGVRVPDSLKGEAHLRLNLSYRFDPPDLTVGDWGVRCTLSFSGSRFQVAVPWSALFALASHATREHWVFPEDMPPELLQHGASAPETEPRPVEARPVLRPAPVQPLEDEDAGPASVEPPSGPRPVLREVPREAPPPTDENPPEPPEKPGRGHLRLVK